MRRAPWLFIVFALLVACSPPPPGCPRQLIDLTGAPNGGFAGGVGGSGGSSAPLALVGAPVSVALFAPLSGCQGDTLRTDVTLTDPDNLPVTNLTVTTPQLNVSGGVGTTVNFTPGKPGLYALKISFEPSLGVRSLFIDVAADPLREASVVRVPILNGANCYTNALWPLSDDTVACEARGPGTVSITSADGGVHTFPGSHLVVVDTVLWSIHPTMRQLERRVWEDGGVRFTHVFADFAATRTPGMHDVDVALRYRSSGELARVRLRSDGGFSVQDLAVFSSGSPSEAFFVEPDDELFRWSDEPCFCTNAFSDLVAVEPGLVWRAELLFDGRASLITASARPTTPAASNFVMTVPQRPEAPGFVTESFERVPLWLEQRLGNRGLLVTARDGGFELAAWPRAEVLRVGRHHLVLTDAQADFVRVIRR